MAVVGKTESAKTWRNADGLLVKFGTAETQVASVGEYNVLGDKHYVEVIIRLAELETAAGGDEQIQSDGVTIPAGAFIEQVDVVVLAETAGANANLDLGLVDQDRSTEIDFNGFLAAADAFNGTTDLGGVTTFTVGSTEVGALVGTKITNTGLITASADTADFTAGVVKIRIWYSVPLAADLVA